MTAYPSAFTLAVGGVWGTVLVLWLLVPLLSGKTLADAARRVPVWAGIAVIEVAALATGQGLVLLAAVVPATAIACAEVVRLAGPRGRSLAGCGIGALLGALGVLWAPVLVLPCAAAIWLLALRSADRTLFPLVAGALFPPLLAPFWMAWQQTGTLPFFIGILLLIHMADITAGFSGKLGGPKAFPRLSPNKTWSGLAGSALVVTLLSAAVLPAAGAMGRGEAALLGILVWGTSVIGDLAASKIKRLAGAKDFSAVLGPHGGMADRLDSLVVTLPLMAVLGFFLRP